MIRGLPLLVCILPVLGVTAAHWLNARAGVLPSCLPLFDGCTSISAAGRYMPGSMPFRASLLPQAAFLAYLWWFCHEWLKQVAPDSGNRKAILICGIVGAVALAVYVTYLGTHQAFYELMRRFGIYFYFLGTAVAQILLALAMSRSALRSAMLWCSGAPFGLGLINLFQKFFLNNSDSIENQIEWIAALLMQVWFALLFVAWRRSGMAVIVRTDRPTSHQ